MNDIKTTKTLLACGLQTNTLSFLFVLRTLLSVSALDELSNLNRVFFLLKNDNVREIVRVKVEHTSAVFGDQKTMSNRLRRLDLSLQIRSRYFECLNIRSEEIQTEKK